MEIDGGLSYILTTLLTAVIEKTSINLEHVDCVKYFEVYYSI
jgi:hypothetical protein